MFATVTLYKGYYKNYNQAMTVSANVTFEDAYTTHIRVD